MSNVLCSFLDKIGYKYSSKTADEYLKSPIRDSLLGIQQALVKLGIDTEGYKLSSVDDLSSIITPFITIKDKKLVIVDDIKDGLVRYSIGRQQYIEDILSFLPGWSFSILEIKAINRLEEPFYNNHVRNFRKMRFIRISMMIIGILLITYFAFNSGFWKSNYSIVLLLFNIMGIIVTSFLYIDYLNIESSALKKVCSILKNSDCKTVSNSRGSKFLKIFHLSEIGLSFYIISTIAIIFFN